VSASLPDPRVTVIEPRRRGGVARARELWRHRGLVRFFAGRATQKMYARTKLGKLWIPLRPILDTSSKALIFGGLLGAQTDGAPYLIFFMAGMAAWTLFDRSLYWMTRSLELNRSLVSKLYFPRLLLPISALAPPLVESLVYFALLLVTLFGFLILDGTWYMELDPLRLAAAVAALMLSVALAGAIAMFTAVLGAATRDMRFTLAYITNFWFFLTPVIYPLSQVPERFRGLAQVNPMTPVVELFKWGLLDGGTVSVGGLAWTCALIVVIASGGLVFFARAENYAVDRV
jgi:lipopolysaccharide transport system permease protein